MDLAAQLDDLRISLTEVDTLAALTTVAFDDADWMEPDSAVVERIACLLGLIEKSSFAAMAAFHRLHGAVADAQPAPAGERWDYDKGTSPGEGMSAQDVAIVQRIREQCPDNRFDGGSDDELIQLFKRNKRNKRVLNRSDEDVIAAMMHPR
jgi:hypothetical protein